MPVKFQSKKNIKSRIIELQDDGESGVDTRFLAERALLASRAPLEYIPLDDVRPNPRAAKKHSPHKIALLTQNMTQFGFTQPIAVDEQNVILLGHARYLAARDLNLEHVPAVRINHLSSNEKRAIALADNKLSQIGEWDTAILSEELQFLSDPSIDLGFDLQILGFETVEIDNLLEASATGASTPKDDAIPEPPSRSVTLQGDLWIAGNHRLLCGDARESKDYRTLMGNDVADMMFTDPPYNVPNAGHVTGRKNVREFAMAAGEMSSAGFSEFLRCTFSAAIKHIKPGAVTFVCMDWRHIGELRSACDPIFGPPRNTIVWVKSNAGMGSFYRSQHEMILPYVSPGASPINNFVLGGKGRYRTNVWQYPGANAFGRQRDESLAMHPTVKPVALVMDALKDCSHRRGIVLDAFGGSGTTMIAAERTGRSARLIEFDPLYCDVIIQRWQSLTGETARLARTDEAFDQIKALRAPAAI